MNYSRVPHLVRAERLIEPWRWKTTNGDEMVACVDDYRLTDPATGSQWSITPAALSVSYAAVDERTFVSRGQVHARQVALGDRAVLVTSVEGQEYAQPDDWIVSDEFGNRWVVKDAWFRGHYRPLSE